MVLLLCDSHNSDLLDGRTSGTPRSDRPLKSADLSLEYSQFCRSIAVERLISLL